jgi:hypothetical protein
VHYHDYEDILNDYQKLMNALTLPEEICDAIWSKTMKHLLEKT